jgi:type II secretory pathway predicted ATPase ExeA/outer membrane protein OmpA-like peptidoglycan-associated protein
MQGYAAGNSVQVQLLSHFGLRENPFGVTPDPRFLFLSQTHQEALASLIVGIDCGFGFLALVAQPGMGKTTLLFNLLEQFRRTAHTAFLFQPRLEPYELLQTLLFELGASSKEMSLHNLAEQLHQVLGRAAQERKRVIVVVDEAQDLESAVLETLRQLSNFEAPHSKLMQIILAGQPQLVKNLALSEQEPLRQRISSIGRLSPLALNETGAYINHRLRTAGYMGSDLFTQDAVRKVWNRSKGVPRNINTLCFSAMLFALAKRAKSIDESVLEEAARDLDLNNVLSDVYQIEAPMAVSAAKGEVQPIRAPEAPDIDNLRHRAIEEPVAVSLSTLRGAEAIAPAAYFGDRKPGEAGEDIPSALAEVASRISQGLDKQRVLLGPESIVAEGLPPAMLMTTLTTRTGEALQPPTSVESSTVATNHGDCTANLGQVSPLKTLEKTAQPKPVPHLNIAALQPGKVGAESGYLSQAHLIHSPQTIAKKRSEHGRLWLKMLSLAAFAGILAWVLVGKFSLHPGSVPRGPEVSDSAQGDSAMDAPIAPRGNTAAGARAPRNASSAESGAAMVPSSTDANVGPEASGKSQTLDSILFEQDSDMIGWQYRSSLRQIADALAENPKARAVLEGHTDSSGPESYNLDLSSRRATAVRDALINELHVSSTRLSAIGMGSAAPIQPNSSAAGRAYNRRVEVRLVFRPSDVLRRSRTNARATPSTGV